MVGGFNFCLEKFPFLQRSGIQMSQILQKLTMGLIWHIQIKRSLIGRGQRGLSIYTCRFLRYCLKCVKKAGRGVKLRLDKSTLWCRGFGNSPLPWHCPRLLKCTARMMANYIAGSRLRLPQDSCMPLCCPFCCTLGGSLPCMSLNIIEETVQTEWKNTRSLETGKE